MHSVSAHPTQTGMRNTANPLRQRIGELTPFLTVAIPQYKRRRYLELNLETVFGQTYKNFEILISDDMSPDDSNEVIPSLLEKSGRSYRYYAQPINLGYDGNVRFCLGNANGRYVLLLGNDDALTSPTTLQEIADAMKGLNYPEVAITNYEDWESKQISKRAYGTGILGSGPQAAVHYFRSFSFVSGLIFNSGEAARHETDRWDTSIYYQIYLACRILAAGGRLGGLDVSAIRDHIRLDGELVPETYRNKYKNAGWSFRTKHTGLDSVARVTVDAIVPYVEPADHSRVITKIWKQLLLITYPYWVLEYRRLVNWSWGVAVARDLWPACRLPEYPLKLGHKLYLWLLYITVTMTALVIPSSIFTRIRHRVAEVVRRRRQANAAGADGVLGCRRPEY